MNTQEKINALKKEIEKLEKQLEQGEPFNFSESFCISIDIEPPLLIGGGFCIADGLEKYTALYVHDEWECRIEEGFEGRQRLMFFKKK